MNWAEKLRRDLRGSNQHYAVGVPHYESRGGVVLYYPFADGRRHGNFHDESFRAILEHPAWRCRLDKSHAQVSALPSEHANAAKELDSSMSSDALLMNLFCSPGFPESPEVRRLLAASSDGSTDPVFGAPGRVPLVDGSCDRTEVDMLFGGDVFIEAKLTEVDFTDSPLEHVLRYRDFQSVFDTTLLPRSGSRLHHYQLVRNVLAASAHDRRCTLFCDARRPDLIRSWWTVVRAIREGALRARCGLVLWQELVAAAPDRLKSFLAVKYGFEV